MTGTGFKLGLSVQNRRKDHKICRITPERVDVLEAIAGWTWSLRDDAWEKGYERLRRFIAKHGDGRVNRDYRDEDGYRLGSWVAVFYEEAGAAMVARGLATEAQLLVWVGFSGGGTTANGDRRARAEADGKRSESQTHVQTHVNGS